MQGSLVQHAFSSVSVSGDVSSEYGSISEFENQRAHDHVAEWLSSRVRESEISSGIGSICFSNTIKENFDENVPPPPIVISLSQTNKELPQNMFFNPSKIPRRNSC